MDLEREAQALSSFGGIEAYSGMGGSDDFLDFDGEYEDYNGKSFAEESEASNSFGINIVNANASARIATFFAGYHKRDSTLAPGQVTDGAFNDLNAAAGLTGASQEEKTISELTEYLYQHPRRILGVQINTDSEEQIASSIVSETLSPFRTERSRSFKPSKSQDQNIQQTTIIICKTPDLYADAYTKIRCSIVGSSSSTFTWFFGAGISVSNGLRRKTGKAKRTVKSIKASK
jgi:hypothetical protein